MEIVGTVKKKKGPFGPSKDWYVLKLADGKTVTGPLANIQPGDRCRFFGQWKNTKKYGRQFATDRAVVELPNTAAAMARYLERLPWIGKQLAVKLIHTYGPEKIIDVLDAGPEALAQVPGISADRASDIHSQWKQIRGRREIDRFLDEHRIGPGLLGRLRETFDEDDAAIVARLKKDPYRLADQVHGVGFLTADRIAESVGIPPEDPRRIVAGLDYCLKQSESEGHVFLPEADLIRRAEMLLLLDAETIQRHLGGDLVKLRGRVYRPRLNCAEQDIAEDIRRLMACGGAIMLDDVDLDGLDPDQRAAVEASDAAAVSIVTGPPGSGKTYCLKKILEGFGHRQKIKLAAPTGKAAQRMAEATGCPAQTLHRLLEFHPKLGFQRNRRHPLEGDLFVVDEASMIDTYLMLALMSAIPEHAKVIFMGDADQLPSVGPGNVLGDMIASGTIPVSRLRTLHRQAAGSLININAQRINAGESILPGSADADFEFVEMDDVEAIRDRVLLEAARFSPWDLQVLTPMKRGPIGTEELNRRLRETFNTSGRKIHGTDFRLNDKVIQNRNNYDLEVFNGDIGNVCAEVEGDLIIEFSGVGVVRYPRDAVGDLGLAYALTTHKAQGSEFPIVLMPIHRTHYMMLRKDLLYTAVSRAKERMTLVGSREAVDLAIRKEASRVRYTSLDERLVEEFRAFQPEMETAEAV